jgi:hypothetical protein
MNGFQVAGAISVMADVCCPKCWAWSAAGQGTTCKACGTLLILADGRALNEASLGMPAPAFATLSGTPVEIRANRRGVDWVLISRLMCFGQCLLGVLVLLAFSFFASPTATSVDRAASASPTLSRGVSGVLVGILALGLYAFFAWLAKFTALRILYLALAGLACFGLLSTLVSRPTSGLSLISLFFLMYDLVFTAVLLKSLMPRSTAG